VIGVRRKEQKSNRVRYPVHYCCIKNTIAANNNQKFKFKCYCFGKACTSTYTIQTVTAVTGA